MIGWRKTCAPISLACAVMACVTQGRAQADNWAGLERWIGQYPTGNAAGRAGLAGTEPVQSIIKAITTPTERARLASYGEASPVETIAGDIVANYCKPHDCGQKSAVLVIDPRQKLVWLGFYSVSGTAYVTNWVGNADPAMVPSAVQKSLAARHSPF
ncbi:MAG TPA: hypothetical protein VMB73_11995 [Acetobacteraceae bacterium]|jgi:hypothetical protein|nr:hypothetical protein [Acetobacteraceae bacterium]